MRSTEVKLVADLLSVEAESVDELAKAVIKALDEDRKKRDTYVVRAKLAEDVFGIGPFVTQGAALKAARALHPEASEEVLAGSVARLIPLTWFDEVEVTGPQHYCDDCGHPQLAHNWPKSKVPGCVVSGCMCGKPTAPPVP